MKSLADKFFALKPNQRRQVHFDLCQHALTKWNQYANKQGLITYIESVVGSEQQVDKQLPADALQSTQRGADAEQ
ncbi:MAG: hypothetical protein GY803_21545, partial [Chloroflexi bacterium]|nr:hypothetical protein [Chloroflexota bacterium]